MQCCRRYSPIRQAAGQRARVCVLMARPQGAAEAPRTKRSMMGRRGKRLVSPLFVSRLIYYLFLSLSTRRCLNITLCNVDIPTTYWGPSTAASSPCRRFDTHPRSIGIAYWLCHNHLKPQRNAIPGSWVGVIPKDSKSLSNRI